MLLSSCEDKGDLAGVMEVRMGLHLGVLNESILGATAHEQWVEEMREWHDPLVKSFASLSDGFPLWMKEDLAKWRIAHCIRNKKPSAEIIKIVCPHNSRCIAPLGREHINVQRRLYDAVAWNISQQAATYEEYTEWTSEFCKPHVPELLALEDGPTPADAQPADQAPNWLDMLHELDAPLPPALLEENKRDQEILDKDLTKGIGQVSAALVPNSFSMDKLGVAIAAAKSTSEANQFVRSAMSGTWAAQAIKIADKRFNDLFEFSIIWSLLITCYELLTTN